MKFLVACQSYLCGWRTFFCLFFVRWKGVTHIWMGHSHVGVTHVWKRYSHVGVTPMWKKHSHVGVTHVWKRHSCVIVTDMWMEHSHVGVTHMWKGHSCVTVTDMWKEHWCVGVTRVEGAFMCGSDLCVEGAFTCGVGVTHVWWKYSCVGVSHVWDEPPKCNSSPFGFFFTTWQLNPLDSLPLALLVSLHQCVTRNVKFRFMKVTCTFISIKWNNCNFYIKGSEVLIKQDLLMSLTEKSLDELQNLRLVRKTRLFWQRTFKNSK